MRNVWLSCELSSVILVFVICCIFLYALFLNLHLVSCLNLPTTALIPVLKKLSVRIHTSFAAALNASEDRNENIMQKNRKKKKITKMSLVFVIKLLLVKYAAIQYNSEIVIFFDIYASEVQYRNVQILIHALRICNEMYSDI